MSAMDNLIADDVARIEQADEVNALNQAVVLYNEFAGPEELDPRALSAIRAIIPVIERRPDLCRTALCDLLDSLAVAAYSTDDSTSSSSLLAQEIRTEVGRSLGVWLSRLVREMEDAASRVGALRVLSYYDPKNSTVSDRAASFLETFSLDEPLWYVAFDAGRRILALTEKWEHVLTILVERAQSDSVVGNSNPPLPRAEVAILVSSLPYQQSRNHVFEKLKKWHALEVVEDALYLPRKSGIEVLAYAVTRMNKEYTWVDGGGFYLIYLLLRCVFFTKPGRAEYTAQRGRVIYTPEKHTGERAVLTAGDIAALEPVLQCTRLWQVENNLLSIFGLPSDREGFEAWIAAHS